MSAHRGRDGVAAWLRRDQERIRFSAHQNGRHAQVIESLGTR